MNLLLNFSIITVIASSVACCIFWLYLLVSLILLRIRYNSNISLEERKQKYAALTDKAQAKTAESLGARMRNCMLIGLVCLGVLWFFSTDALQPLVLATLNKLAIICTSLFVFSLAIHLLITFLTPQFAKENVLAKAIAQFHRSTLIIGLIFCMLNWLLGV